MGSKASANVTIVNGYHLRKPNGFIVFMACFLFLVICRYWYYALPGLAVLGFCLWAYWLHLKSKVDAAGLAARADQQHAWVMQGDIEHGVFGQPKEDK